MPRRYGFPYKGSKSRIVSWLLGALPPGDVFVDLFAGGCAVTHGAMLSGMYRSYVANDVAGTALLFADAIHGRYADEDRWIGRDDFFALKDTDAYVRWIWSFGNDGRTYMYGRDIEPWKRAFHYAVFYRDARPFSDLGVIIPAHVISGTDMGIRYRSLSSYLRSLSLGRPFLRLESCARLQGLHELRGLQGCLRVYSLDYQDVPIPSGAVVYCDIPYKGTNVYDSCSAFDYERFYSWALSRDFPVFVSEYAMPEGFSVVDGCVRTDTMCATDNAVKRIERVFVQDRFACLYRRTLFDMCAYV